MSFKIIRNDITKVKADVIVNSANPEPIYGTGTDTAIYQAAGEEELLDARKKIGKIAPGEARYTPAFRLQAQYIIHTVGPYWVDGKHGEADQLRNCYRNSLDLAKELNVKSIAFPLISTGNYGFPKDLALQIALESFSSCLFTWPEVKITLVVFDQRAFVLSQNVFGDLDTFIDENYVSEQLSKEAAISGNYANIRSRFRTQEKTETTFQQDLLRKIDEEKLKDPEFYHAAGLSKQVFSKIRSNQDYQPSRNTAIACALALHLDQEEADDLLRKAGYALSPTSKFDLIISYCIQNQIYNLMDVNAALYDHGEKQIRIS